MEGITAETAAQAIAQAWQTDEPQGTPAPEYREPPVTQEAPSEGQTESNQDEKSGLFYGVDPNTLTPELRQMFDGMNKSYTTKMQELAEERKQYEAFGGLEQVGQAMDFVQSLQDPQNLVQLHTELSQYLQEAGYTKAAADAAATSAIDEQSETQESDYGFADPEVASLNKQLAELQAWKQGFEEQQEQARIEAAIERTELALRQDRGYDDTDVSRIYQLSYAYGADLTAAADAYDSMRNDVISSYINKKAEAPGATAAPPLGTFGQKPESFGSDLNAAHKYAKDLMRAAQAAGEFDD